MDVSKYCFCEDKNELSKFKTIDNEAFNDKPQAKKLLKQNIKNLSKLQNVLFADKKYSVLIILQGMDASGKDSLIKHVFSGINPQGIKVHSFSTPSSEEFAHDYMWRVVKELPERGFIGVYNRSHYEEVLITRVHPEFLNKQQLPHLPKNKKEFDLFWKTRFEDISNFERYLTNNGVIVLKFFMHISKDEQKNRFLRRIDKSHKNWKFRADDLSERAYWDDYMQAYEDMIKATSTKFAPWHIIPGDNKKHARPIVAEIIKQKLESLDLKYPSVSYKEKRGIIKSKKILMNEDKVPLKKGSNPALD